MSQQSTLAGAPKPASTLALASWVLFDWAGQPFYTLILTFLFAPYFTNVVASDPATGQALWGYAAAVAGVLIACLSPLLGAAADGTGRRKPWIFLFSVIFACGQAALWFAYPASQGLAIWGVLAAFVVATVAVEFTTVFTNAMMPSLVTPDKLGRLSGTGWAVGYAGGLVSLALFAGLLVPDPFTGKTMIGLTPPYLLDLETREGERLVGPASAVWYLVFMLPFFAFVPDRPPQRRAPAASPFTELVATLKGLPSDRDVLYFLLARMLYSDGLSAIFAFGGIYGATVFQWRSFELGIFGIMLTLTGVFGALIGGVIDDRAGAKRVIVGALLLLIIGALGILSVDKTHAFYVVEVAEKAPGSGAFSSAGEKVFLAFSILVGLVAAPVQAASRSLLAQLAPKDKVTQYFGLFAFSGKVTAFLAPLLVAGVTNATGDQRLGMASIAVFLIAGMLLMLPVTERRV